MRMGLKGFAPDELEPRTSDGELVADLLASAGVQFECGSRRSHDSAASSAAARQRAASSSVDSASPPAHGQQARQDPGRLRTSLYVAYR